MPAVQDADDDLPDVAALGHAEVARLDPGLERIVSSSMPWWKSGTPASIRYASAPRSTGGDQRSRLNALQ